MAISLAVVGIFDLLSKRWIATSFVLNERRAIVPHVLDFTYAANTHGAMGLFGDRSVLLVVLALAVLATLYALLRSTLRSSPAAQIGFGCVAGGALGNVVDRIVHGYVIDFISVPHFFIFNVADAAIAVGLAAIAYPSLARKRPVPLA